jgi:hypothetical protein
MLVDELAKHRVAILERWFEDVIDNYPDETGKFLKEQSDPFANPVGAGLHQGLSEILDGLVNSVNPVELEASLDLVVRVRAVQEFTPAEAVDFVFRLKSIVREMLGDRRKTDHEEWAEFDHSIDRLASLAFDVYMRCREQMWAIRAKEIRTQSLGILERMQEWREKRADEMENA